MTSKDTQPGRDNMRLWNRLKRTDPKAERWRRLPTDFPPVVTLCGSTRFKRAYREWNASLTLNGCVVFSVAMWSHAEKINPTDEQKSLLDKIHLRKIDLSDSIFVLDVGGYVGESTRREIDYATATGKQVIYLSDVEPDWTEDDCLFVYD